MSGGISSNPAARLPYTWYGLSRSVPSNADYDMTNKTYRYVNDAQRAMDVLYPFGYGLSYTQFFYTALRVPPVLWQPTLSDSFNISFGIASLGPYYAGTCSNCAAPFTSFKYSIQIQNITV